MKVEPEKLKLDNDRDIYWARIYFTDDSQKRSVVLLCASCEYLWDHFNSSKIDEERLQSWFQEKIEKWKVLNDKIFDKPIYYDIYATSDEGRYNAFKFLEEKI